MKAVILADGKGTRIAAITTDGVTQVWDRQRSSAAALLPKKPAANQPAVANAADGWEDLLARLTPEQVEKTGHGWSLKDGELFSPEITFATLPLPAEVPGTSYRVRVKLRRVKGERSFHIVLPVADRMCGFDLEGRPHGGIYTGLVLVNGKFGKDLPGAVQGKQVKDSKPHDLEVTVRLAGLSAVITITLDGQPLYEWAGRCPRSASIPLGRARPAPSPSVPSPTTGWCLR